MSHHISDNIGSCNNIGNASNSYTVADEKFQILAWLSPLEPQRRHKEIRAHRVNEVGDWLLKTQEYRNWLGSNSGGEFDGSALFCYGGPGVGKTYISSLVVDTLCRQAVGKSVAVACFYFDFAAQEEQSPAAILGAVLKQIVGGLDEIPERIANAFRDRERVSGSQELVLSEIVELLRDVSSSRCTYICIDALDEYQARDRVKLLDSLSEILRESPGVRIFLTGRPHIRGEVDKHLAGRAATISITPTKGDIVKFLRAKLKEDTMRDEMNQSLEEEIIESIPEIVSEIFLLAALSIETILQEVTIHRRRLKLSSIKEKLDLGGAYEAALGRIKVQGGGKEGGEEGRLGMAVLMWITHSRRPLKVDEICHAVAIQIDSNDLDNDDIPAISTLLDYCQGLVTIDKGTSTVILIHSTLQEYLRTRPDLFDRAHSKMAEICLTYLNFRHIKNLSGGPSPDPRSTPFLEYSSLYWGTHMRIEPSDRAKTSALQLLYRFNGHISAQLLWNSISWEFTMGPTPDRKPFSALHCSSYFGVANIAKDILIKMDRRDVNQRDSAGMTPLIWAARYGHGEVVKLLLEEKHIQPDQQDTNYGRTALSWAAENGHVDVVRLLLGPRFVNYGSIGRRWGKARRVTGQLFGRRYVNPDSSGEYEKTPLLWAAKNGHGGVVEVLLKRGDVNPNNSDRYGRTPLLWAARNGGEGAVKLLLERKDVNPDIPDAGYCQTPLSWAAGNGREEVVKLLLAREDVDPDGLAESGGTPLLWAAENGYEGIVKLLLERGGASPDIPGGKYGQTPLSRAAQNGHEGVVKLLLGRNVVNPNTQDMEFGRTPLSWAAGNGHEGVVRLLLEQESVDPNNSTKSGRTPLWLAAANGHEGIVKLLLEQSNANPDTPDLEVCRTPPSQAAENGREGEVELLLGLKYVEPQSASRSGRTLLLWAAQNGSERFVKLLLRRKNASPDTRDTKFGRTPLSWAAGNGHEGIVKLLLEREDVQPDSPDTKFGRTPLLRAARNGHEGIVKLLLERRDANPGIAETSYGQTPLSRAAQNGREGVVKLLLGRNDVKPDTRDTKLGRTPLSWAAGNGHEGIVKLLLEREDVRPDTQDVEFGRTPLSWAAGDGHDGVVEILLRHQGVKPHSSSKSGRTPLLWAAKNGHERIVKRLLERIDVKPDTPDAVFGQTPLSWAARNGREGVVKLLLERKDVDPNSSSKSGQTPLTLAAEHGHNGVVELLQVQYPRPIR